MNWVDIGGTLARQGLFNPARIAFGKALEQDRENAALRAVHANMLRRLWRFHEAREEIDRALAMQPNDGQSWFISGALHLETNNARLAIEALDRAVTLPPGGVLPRWTRAVAMLHAGRWRDGFAEYECRFEKDEPKPSCIPRWDGRSPGRLLVDAEQGYGDAIMFSRYLPEGAVFRVPPPLVRYMQAQGIEAVSGLEEVDADWRIPVMSLPLVLGKGPIAGRHKAPGQPRLERKGRFNVGLVWQSKAAGAGGFEEWLHGEQKSCPVDLLADLADIPGVALYSLQTGSAGREAERSGGLIEQLRIWDFADMAAYMAQLDLVVSVDTAPIHLAGMLGVPAILLLNYPGSWQWQGGAKSIWYPSVEIIRQPKPFDWQGAVNLARVRIEKMS